VLAARERLRARIRHALQVAPVGAKTRIHGDLHLQQILVRRDDFVIIDFEGEPARPIAERRLRSSAMRDVAGMLRSFDYARESALQVHAQAPALRERAVPLLRQWERRAREAFLDAYWAAVVEGGLYDAAQRDDALALLELFEIGKALYELRYEIDNRPDWIGVPLAGLAAFAEVDGRAAAGGGDAGRP
jgi:maltose alpha-D-glucosyltransferase/alpha-amylase